MTPDTSSSVLKRLTISNDIQELRGLPAFTEDIFKECALDSRARILVRSGLDEALTNCIKYAYARDVHGTVEVSGILRDGCLVFVLEDSGIEFNPLEYKAPAASGDLKVGGLGIQMYKSAFDRVEYERRDGHNILKLTRKL